MDNQSVNVATESKDFKFCQNCGAKIDKRAVVCPKCGVPVANANVNSTTNNNEENPSVGWGFLGFFFPIVGWILYFVFKKDTPKRAHRCAVWAWIGFGVQVLFYILYAAMIAAAYPYY